MCLAAVDYRWSLQPQVLAALLLVAGVYWWRVRELHRGQPMSRAERARAASFAAGIAVLFVALCSPIDTLGEERLFTVHWAGLARSEEVR